MTDPIARATQGMLRGHTLSNGVNAFLGIPYGADTGGARRFRPPQPAMAWDGIRDAHGFGPSCPQGKPTLPEDDPASTRGHDWPVGEDCLVLNVWTPAHDDAGSRPVMVWIHGGAFRMGTGSHPVTDGANLAAHGDVVVVSLNHRLNVFGHLFLGELCGPEFAASGVAGQLDIILALQWVHDNIAAFGGDPGNVTVFGESGGGRKISLLMAMPAAQGLFHRAIIQSGAHTRGIPREVAARVALRFSEHLGLRPGDLEGLQAIPADVLFERSDAFFDTVQDPLIPRGALGRWLLSPSVDGVHLPTDPCAADCSLMPAVPLLIGSNKDEAALTLARAPGAGHLTEAEMHQRLQPVLGERTGAVIAAHRGHRPAQAAWDTYVTIASEDRRLLSIELAQHRSAQGRAPVFMYYFTWESDYGLFRAAHTMEIPFVFRTLHSTAIVGQRPDREALSDIVSNAWIAFARNGNPGMPDWRPYDAATRATMFLDVPARMENDPYRNERLAWGGAPTPLPWEENSLLSAVRGAQESRSL